MIMINFLYFKISAVLLGDVDNIRLSTSMKSIITHYSQSDHRNVV